jgi:hypothetical protein
MPVMYLKKMSTLGGPPVLMFAVALLLVGASAARAANYRPQFLAKTRTIDWVRLTEDVRKDIAIARNPKPH